MSQCLQMTIDLLVLMEGDMAESMEYPEKTLVGNCHRRANLQSNPLKAQEQSQSSLLQGSAGGSYNSLICKYDSDESTLTFTHMP